LFPLQALLTRRPLPALKQAFITAIALKRAVGPTCILKALPQRSDIEHGQLLAAEIEDLVGVIKLETAHDTRRNWEFYREAGRKMLWPHIDAEYQQELKGIAKGVQSKGVKLDVWDIVALNGRHRAAAILCALAEQA
jgi:hypothetical protein